MCGSWRGCEGMMMMVVTMKMGSWHIMREQIRWRGEEATTSRKNKLFKGSQINSHLGEWKQDHQGCWWLFKWGNFMSMVIRGEWGKFKGWCKKRGIKRRKKLGMLVVRFKNKGKGLPSYATTRRRTKA